MLFDFVWCGLVLFSCVVCWFGLVCDVLLCFVLVWFVCSCVLFCMCEGRCVCLWLYVFVFVFVLFASIFGVLALFSLFVCLCVVDVLFLFMCLC